MRIPGCFCYIVLRKKKEIEIEEIVTIHNTKRELQLQLFKSHNLFTVIKAFRLRNKSYHWVFFQNDINFISRISEDMKLHIQQQHTTLKACLVEYYFLCMKRHLKYLKFRQYPKFKHLTANKLRGQFFVNFCRNLQSL